ncbi:MAG: diguanylate cyclase [Gemmatimonas sp. SG8_17]|nr:MAG: diguanylate cyclase [Gemmatimonas sp. SG8_17]
MLGFVVRRVLQAVPLLLLISVLVFALIHAAPGGPLEMYLANPNVRPEDIERLRVALGLDRPIAEQYVAWLKGFIVGEWGYSFTDGRPVLQRLLERLPATLELIASAVVVAALVALPLGVFGALRKGGWVDHTTTVVSFAGISLPVFWVGLLLQLVFAVALGWLPSSGRASFGDGNLPDRLSHLIMPAVVLAAVHAAAWSRFLRSSMGTAVQQRFILAARARGIQERRVVWWHALRNALLPFVTVLMMDAAIMVTGAVITESVFAWPGLGSLFTEALARRDYTVLMAFLMMTSAAVVFLNLAADVFYHALDPRVRVR